MTKKNKRTSQDFELPFKMFKQFAESASSGLGMADLEGAVKYVNPALCNMLEITPEDILNKSFISYYPKEMQKKLKEEVFPTLMEKGSWKGELEFITKNGKTVKTYESYAVIFDEEGKPQFINDVIRDISELKRLKEIEMDDMLKKQKKAEEKFSHFIKYLPFPLCNVDNDTGDILYFNETFHDMFGYTIKDIPNLEDWWIKAYPEPKYREWVLKNWGEAVENASKTDSEIRSDVYNVTCKNGEVKKVIIGGITLGEEFLATFIDVTEQQKAQKEKEELLYNLNERLKEMSTLYQFEQIENSTELSTEQALQKIVEILPAGWQFPEYTEAVIKYDNTYYKTENYKKTNYILEAPIEINEKVEGFVRVVYTKKMIPDQEDQFLDEEQKLIEAIASNTANLIKRRKYEKQLIESEKKFRDIVNAINDGIYNSNNEGNLTYVNHALCDIFGYKEDEILGKPFGIFIVPEAREKFIEAYKESFKTKKAHEVLEVPVLKKDGTKIIVEIKPTIIFKDDIPVGSRGVVRDVTDRKEWEQKIKDSEQRYRSFVENFHGIAFRSNMDWTPLYFHGAVKEITGYSEAEFINGNPRWDQIVHKDDIKQLMTQTAQKDLEKEGYAAQREYRIINKKGKTKWVVDYIQTVADETSGEHILQGALYDITKRKNAEQELEKINQELQENIEEKTVVEEELRATNESLQEEIEQRKQTEEELQANIQQRVAIEEELRATNETLEEEVEERRKTQEKLHQSEEKFRRLTENAQDMIYRMSLPDGEYEYVSPASEIIWGYTPKEVMSHPKLIADCIHPDFENYFKEEWQKLINGNMSPKYEYKIIDKHGNEKWLYQRNVLVKNTHGKAIAIEGIVTDITDRVHAQERFEKIFELSSDLICIADINGYFRLLNPAWEKIMGYTTDELMGKPFLDFIHPDDKESTLKVITEKLEKGETVLRFENRYIKKDGSVVWLEWTSQPNILEGITFAMARDVTDRKESEIQLKEQEERFRTLFDAEPDAILTADPMTGKLLQVNKAAEELFKRPVEELIGMHQTMLHPPEMRDGIVDKFIEIAIEGSNKPQEVVILDGEGNIIPVEVVGSVTEMQGKSIAVGIFRDISERKKAEEALLKKNTELETFNKMAVGREKRMVELKRKINKLSKELGKDEPYDLSFVDNND